MPEKKIAILIKTSLVDYPALVACTIFLKGCNLRCPYCYNIPLVLEDKTLDDGVTLTQLKAHLKKRKNVLSGVAISGGEALLHPELKNIIAYAKSLGYKVKLDTNGTNSQKLKELTDDKTLCPDFIAMDIKTSPDRYKELLSGTLENQKNYEQEIKSSIAILSSLKNTQIEYRTVLVPTLITSKEINEIANLIPSNSTWRLANFLNKECLDPLYNSLMPYTEEEAKSLEKLAQSIVKDTLIR